MVIVPGDAPRIVSHVASDDLGRSISVVLGNGSHQTTDTSQGSTGRSVVVFSAVLDGLEALGLVRRVYKGVLTLFTFVGFEFVGFAVVDVG
jgi:hypothetical protein